MNEGALTSRLPETVVRMTGPNPSGTLAFLPDLGGNLIYARLLVQALRADAGCVGLRLDPGLARDIDRLTVADLGRRFAADLLRADLPGPLHLLGFSFAGFVAYETARSLEALGAPPARLWLIDSQVLRKLPGHPLLRRPLAEAAYAVRYAARNWRVLLPGPADPDRLARYGLLRMDLSQHPVGHRPIIRGLYRAMGDYRPAPWPEGRAVLVRARDDRHRGRLPRDLGWRELIPGCTVIEVAGDHLTMLREPCGVAQVAAALRDALGSYPAGVQP